MFRSTVLNICFILWTLVLSSSALIAAQFGGPQTVRWFLRRWALGGQWLTRNILGATIEIRGLEQFRDGARPALIVSKHQSELDVFIPLALYPDLGAIAMLELERYPLIGPIIRKLGYILVSVEGAQSNQLRQVVEGARRVHAEGRPILIYPEGELMRVGSRQRYKSGVYHIYEALGCEATPVALSCGLVWPKRNWVKHPNRTCVIEFMAPIPAGLDRARFMQEIETRIETRSMELIEEHGDPDTIALARERHRLGLTNEDEVTVSDLKREVANA
ncbi:MAG: 1-acyl-sn-glycerol-3-phosphate acyltransferase [Neomegalonema sp.]|nr:1-acyl-sn-glycerol-3-phosphate acyltransferase [Neomegalonema sp.]